MHKNIKAEKKNNKKEKISGHRWGKINIKEN